MEKSSDSHNGVQKKPLQEVLLEEPEVKLHPWALDMPVSPLACRRGGHKHTNAHSCVQNVPASAPWAVDQVCVPHWSASLSPPAGAPTTSCASEEMGQVQPECGEVPTQRCLEVQGLDVRSPSL